MRTGSGEYRATSCDEAAESTDAATEQLAIGRAEHGFDVDHRSAIDRLDRTDT